MGVNPKEQRKIKKGSRGGAKDAKKILKIQFSDLHIESMFEPRVFKQ